MLSIMNDASRLLAMLQGHAAVHGELRCHTLPDRVITYRRLWSRIERASARLQGEWGVQPGQTVAYVGCGHPDAIVLYAALLRTGARFLPLEALAAPAAAGFLALSGAVLVVADDGRSLPEVPVRPLSQLLADWCHHDPVVVGEDPAARSLLLPTPSGELAPVSQRELCAALPDRAVPAVISGPIFTPECLSATVLPALRDAQVLHFASAADRLTGS